MRASAPISADGHSGAARAAIVAPGAAAQANTHVIAPARMAATVPAIGPARTTAGAHATRIAMGLRAKGASARAIIASRTIGTRHHVIGPATIARRARKARLSTASIATTAMGTGIRTLADRIAASHARARRAAMGTAIAITTMRMVTVASAAANVAIVPHSPTRPPAWPASASWPSAPANPDRAAKAAAITACAVRAATHARAAGARARSFLREVLQTSRRNVKRTSKLRAFCSCIVEARSFPQAASPATTHCGSAASRRSTGAFSAASKLYDST
jgi:hypothetical protein